MFKFATKEDGMKVLAIAPYPGLKELLSDIGSEQPFELRVETGDLNAGLQYAQEAEKNGTDVIVSRGGTAELIQEKVSIPVIDIEVSGYDMLRVITLIKDFPGKAAIVGFSAIAEGASAVCSLVDIEVKTITITEADEVYSKLESLQRSGYQVIVGDVITVKIAEELGLNGILLTSGKESVIKAFNEARKSFNIIENMRIQYGISDAVLRNMQQYVLVLDQDQKTIYCNGQQANYLKEMIMNYFKDFDNAVEQVSDTPLLHFFCEKDGFIWGIQAEGILNNQLIVFFINKEDKLKAINGLNIKINQHRVTGPSTVLKGRLSENYKMNNMYAKALRFTKTDKNILIEGERGTGKERTAELIHLSSERHQEPFVMVDCEMINEEDLEYIMSLSSSKLFPFVNGGTFFLKNIHLLPIAAQKNLMTGVEAYSNMHIISSASKELSSLVQDAFLSSLYEKVAELRIFIPPLRERKEDIESLISLFINECNIRYGKQISGVREESLSMLQHPNWYGNISELYKVIEEAVLISDNSYLEEEDINEALLYDWEKKEINLSGTLSEIETRIIEEVLEQENFNHSQTAKRLGINRTTLWRKLKQKNNNE